MGKHFKLRGAPVATRGSGFVGKGQAMGPRSPAVLLCALMLASQAWATREYDTSKNTASQKTRTRQLFFVVRTKLQTQSLSSTGWVKNANVSAATKLMLERKAESASAATKVRMAAQLCRHSNTTTLDTAGGKIASYIYSYSGSS